MLRIAWPLLMVVTSACAGAAPPPRPAPKVTVALTPSVAPEKAAPPEPQPLPEVAMQLKIHARHADAYLSFARPRPVDEKLIADNLEQPWRTRFQTALAATTKLEKAHAPVADAYYKVLSCSDAGCGPAETKLDRLRAAFEKQSDAITRAHDKTVQAFEKQLEKAPSAALGLALARLHHESNRQSDIVTMNHPVGSSFDYGELPSGSDAGTSSLATPALERAKEHSEATTDLGRAARRSLMLQRFVGGDGDGALAEVEGLMAHAPAEQRYELHARHGLLLGYQNEHKKAAEALGRALDQPEGKDEPVPRAQLRLARVVAEYRGGRFREALALALTELDRGPSRSAPFSGRAGPELRLAADALERLGQDVEGLSAKPETRAALSSELSLRALHRHDRKRAIDQANSAIKLSAQSAADAFSVLIALAKQKGDSERARELEEQKKQSHAYGSYGNFGVLALLGGRDAAPEHDERNALKEDAKADAKRNVASLLRLCLEPSFWRLPERGGKQALDVHAALKDDGSIQVEVSGDAPAEISDCLKSMGPSVLARAPTSIRARVDLSEARQSGSSLGGVLGALGGSEAFGAGGLGLRGSGTGGGGSGGGIGLGSLGGLGRGVLGGRGVGKGAGGLGPRPPKKPPPTKKAK